MKIIIDKIIANPPYNKGGKIMQKCFSIIPEADYSILMPASCYFKEDFFKNIKTIESADNNAFGGVAIQKNLCICTMAPNAHDNWTKEDFLMYFCDQNYKDIYAYNIKHFKGYEPIRDDSVDISKLDIETDFIEHARCISDMCGNGFGKKGGGYAFNIEKDLDKAIEHLPSFRFWIHFNSSIEKSNFSKWWYYGGKGKSLSSKLMMGIGQMTMTSIYKYAIPQIDWENISETELWKNGKLDEAVLSKLI